jgi:DNA-binding response OmpR family regulator
LNQNGKLEGATSHVLVVEDDAKLAELMKRVLQRECHIVEIVGDGRDALDILEDGEFDVIVLDRMLPSASGTEVCQRIRKRGDATPVLMLTALDSIDDRVEGLDAGADDYLPKPFAFAELSARIRALTRRRGAVAGTQLQVEDLVLDPAKHEVTRAGNAIDLTPKEFALLEFLMEHPGQVLSRGQIMDQVWGYDFASVANVVDIYVHYLRNKIDKGFSKRLLRTVRGVGYRLGETS